MQSRKSPNIIVDLSFSFALDIIAYCQQLNELKHFVIARQLLKCGTAIGASVREAQNAESDADFVHKFKIAAKEADETQYWLAICAASGIFPECKELDLKATVLIKIISKIIGTAKRSITK